MENLWRSGGRISRCCHDENQPPRPVTKLSEKEPPAPFPFGQLYTLSQKETIREKEFWRNTGDWVSEILKEWET